MFYISRKIQSVAIVHFSLYNEYKINSNLANNVMTKKRKLSHKEKIKLFISIFLIICIGICFGLSVMYGVSQDWIGFAIYFSVAIVISAIEIPIYYLGTIYECPHCGNKFKANPYKVFFTNGILGIFGSILSFGAGSDSKYAKLKCTNCKKKDWCKKHYN